MWCLSLVLLASFVSSAHAVHVVDATTYTQQYWDKQVADYAIGFTQNGEMSFFWKEIQDNVIHAKLINIVPEAEAPSYVGFGIFESGNAEFTGNENVFANSDWVVGVINSEINPGVWTGPVQKYHAREADNLGGASLAPTQSLPNSLIVQWSLGDGRVATYMEFDKLLSDATGDIGIVDACTNTLLWATGPPGKDIGLAMQAEYGAFTLDFSAVGGQSSQCVSSGASSQPDPTPEATPVTPVPTPEPTIEPDPATPESTPEPTPATPKPTPEPTPQVIPEVTPGDQSESDSSGSSGDGTAGSANQSASEWLQLHNERRTAEFAEHSVSDVSLKWSESLAVASKAWAESLLSLSGCNIKHDSDRGAVGENIAMQWGTPGYVANSPLRALQGWYDGEKYIGFSGEYASDADKTSYNYPRAYANGHYTQVANRSTKYVGCGQAMKLDESSNLDCAIEVCRYVRPGNCGSDENNFMERMLLEETPGCGDECPPEGCF